MRKIITTFILSIFLASCDTLYFDDFIVRNNCNDDISVSIIFWNNCDTFFAVKPYNEYYFYSEDGLSKRSANDIKMVCKTIIITKKDTISKVNYNDKWQMRSISETKSEFFFIVNSEDFE